MEVISNRYDFDKSSKKYECPNCGKRRFKRMIDRVKNELLPEQYGRCDREDKCGYLLHPCNDGYAKMIWEQERGNKFEMPKYVPSAPKKIEAPKPIFFDKAEFQKTLSHYSQNTFLNNLLKNIAYPFTADMVTKAVELYYLGTVGKGFKEGAITFPFIDINGNIRAIQAKEFDKDNHTTSTGFLHTILQANGEDAKWLKDYSSQDKKVSCLFGEHLLKRFPNNPVALVEAPKTAIYGTLYFGFPEKPSDKIWLAVYNKSSFSLEKLKVLKNKNVFVFPDLSKDGRTFQEWKTKADSFQSEITGVKFIFSDFLERYASQEQREQGADLADILIKLNWQDFRPKKPKKQYQDYTKE